MRVLEIETLAEIDRRVGAGATVARGWHVQSVDLRERTDALAGLDVTGAVFLGCRFADGVDEDVRRRGGLVFPAVPDVPFDPYRAELYSPDELYAGLDELLRGDAGRPRPRLVARRPRDRPHPRHGAARPRGRRRPGRIRARSAGGGRDGRPRRRAGHGRLPEGGPARPAARTRRHRRHGRRPGCDGGREPRRLARRPPGRRPRLRDHRPGSGAVVRARRHRLGARRDGGARPVRAGTRLTGRAHLVLRPRAARTCSPTTSRSTSATRSARRCCCGSAARGWSSCRGPPAPCRRCSSRPARTTTPGRPTSRRWCSSGVGTGPTLPVWPLLQRLAQDRAMAAHVHLVDDVDDVPALLEDR